MSGPIRPIRWRRGELLLLEQRSLPFKEEWVRCNTVEKVARAIEVMTVRGAPAIGITAAYGVALAGIKAKAGSFSAFRREVGRALLRLRRTRPTAVNLFWALDRMAAKLEGLVDVPPGARAATLEKEALAIHREDEALCRSLGQHGARLLKGRRNILTHCNTGSLATGGEGTALAAIALAARKDRRLHVWVDETRPYLQGARLTAYEVARAGIPFHLITDNMAASLMANGKVDAVIVGADRIISNGDTANKIGTYALAVLARAHRIPFYVSAPTTTLDLTKRNGRQIVIEQRDPKEVTHPQGNAVTRGDYPVHNPAFDVTPGKLVTAIILETGVCRPPYGPSLRRALALAARKR